MTPTSTAHRDLTAVHGDPGKIAQAIIDSVGVSPAPLRLPLGSDGES